MRLAVFLALSTLILSSSVSLAQAFRGLVLVKGDTSKNCSFMSTAELQPVDIAQRLTTVSVLTTLSTGSSPYEVEQAIGFPPDQPYANGVMHWSAVRGDQYVRATVSFRKDQALTRSITVTTNYKQPNEKQCLWEVRDLEGKGNRNLQGPY